MSHAEQRGPRFEGRQVVVIGGSSGIGAAIATGFVEAGAMVTVTGVSAPELAALAQHGSLSAVPAEQLDVRDADAVDAFFLRQAGLDVLVNCAGIIRRDAELDPAVFADVLDINLTGTMRCCSAARPLLARAGGGAIINTASMLSFFGGGRVPGYSASKGGVAQLTKSLAIAYAPDNIRVNAIAPGWIETPLTAGLRADAERSDAILSRTPMGRWGRPEDVIGPALFLASPAAAFVTGAILPVDGGYAIA